MSDRAPRAGDTVSISRYCPIALAGTKGKVLSRPPNDLGGDAVVQLEDGSKETLCVSWLRVDEASSEVSAADCWACGHAAPSRERAFYERLVSLREARDSWAAKYGEEFEVFKALSVELAATERGTVVSDPQFLLWDSLASRDADARDRYRPVEVGDDQSRVYWRSFVVSTRRSPHARNVEMAGGSVMLGTDVDEYLLTKEMRDLGARLFASERRLHDLGVNANQAMKEFRESFEEALRLP